MRLFIWRNVFEDYTSGIAFAMANDAAEARRQAIDAFVEDNDRGAFSGQESYRNQLRRHAEKELSGEPESYDCAKGGYCYGGS